MATRGQGSTCCATGSEHGLKTSPVMTRRSSIEENRSGPGLEIFAGLAVGCESTGGESTVITGIRATGVSLGLGRLPAGFYIVVRHSGLKWKSEGKPSSVDNDTVEWSGSIPIPPDLSIAVCFEIYASFEFQPTLGAGEQLRKLTVTVEQLLGRSTKEVAFALPPKDGDVVSPCSSIFVAVKRRKCETSNPPVSTILGPYCSTMECQGELEDVTDHGHSALSRYRKHGKRQDLERSVERFERALSICPLDHACRATAQSNLAMAKFILCQVGDTGTSFEVPLSLYRDALAARPVGHINRPSTLIHLAILHFARFEKWRDDAEKDQAETLLREAVELSSTESHENRAAAFVLRLLNGRRVDPVRADGQLSLEQDSTLRLTGEDPWTLSVQLLRRFERFGDLADLHQAIASMEKLVRSTSPWDAWYCSGLGNLGVALCQRFNHLGEQCDLEGAISTFRDAVDLIPHGHPDRASHLCNLGGSLRTRFERFGKPDDLEDAIAVLKDAVSLTPHDHPQKPSSLGNLGTSFIARFQRLGELSDIEKAIPILRDAVDFTPHAHPDKPGHLNDLGSSLVTRFMHLGELSDLEDAISMFRDGVSLTPCGHPNKPGRLNNFGNSLITRFEHLGKLSDLEDAIPVLKDAVGLTSHGHPNKPGCLSTLGSAFKARFERLGELNDLEDAISALADAVNLTPHGHPGKSTCLNNLGNSLRARFECLGKLSDLESAISALRDAVDLTPHSHSYKPVCLSNLGYSLIVRFERLGKLSDLGDAILTHRDAVNLTPHGDPYKPRRLSNLGDSLRARFERLGELSDLEDAISRFRDAVILVPYGHPDKSSCLSNLGSSFMIRFKRLGEPSDLEDAISILRDAADLTPGGHPDKAGRLNNLGYSFFTRFEHFGELTDLEDSISRHRYAVDLTPDGHPGKAGRLNNLGNALRTRFERLGKLIDLEDAILTLRDVIYLIPHGHPQKPGYLSNLAHSLVIRFERLGELSDLEGAISTYRDAIGLTPRGHPDKPGHLSNLGNSYITRFERLGEPSDLEQAISLYSHAASTPTGPVSARFDASKRWLSCARGICHYTLLHAYSVAISLLPQLAWIGLPLMHRYFQLARGADVVREAVAAALDSGLPETAVEWLEQGRSIVWGELLHLRSSYEELSSAYPDHARRLRELSAALEHASATREKSLSTLLEQTQCPVHRATESLRQDAAKHRKLAIERDKLLQEIRAFPGFERFLLQKEFSQLRTSAHSGPVVIINVAERRCDALIILADVDHVVHVSLPKFTFQRSAGLQSMLERLLGHARVIVCDDREGNSATRGYVRWETLLSALWDGVVKPVLNALAFSTPGGLSRIFWCPVGPFMFLPLHAAGFYDTEHSQPGHKVSEFVVSSYIPTLSILTLSNPNAAPKSDTRLLAVRQPPSDGLPTLPGVATELEYIRTVIKNSPSARVTLLESSVGTVEEVLALMKEADWVHFACHGMQDAANSGLCLADRRRLKLRDIIAVSRPRGGLAFLSACQTATGEEHLSDEAIHVAAGMLFAGYGGVIGTMWSISDKLAPSVARDVYDHLFRNGTPDYREAALALHRAIGRLRDGGRASFVTWLPFIHVGL